ncbi:hypothetical protein ABFU02_17240 [Xanthomonas campestris pv. raphani]|uniref:hypothetical protein n=1 Tax=Xanthomonas campestris TaxID=339 RepID=UPI002B22604D|nr:hypothetical protein [Xanthomonas campestris]MEA9779315.1 hypothetical protein [Xanthomonas campestris pv. raphani]
MRCHWNSRLILQALPASRMLAVMLFCLANSKQQTANSKQQTADSRQQTARGGGASAHPLPNAAATHGAAPSSSNKDLVVIKLHARKPEMRSFSLQERCQRDRLRTSTAQATCRAIDCAQFRITRACLHRIAHASPH